MLKNIFYPCLDNLKLNDNSTFWGQLDSEIITVNQLMINISSKLLFPEYFGKYWDALYDCLCDLHWIDKKNIVIIHSQIPKIPVPDLKIYLEILKDACLSWQNSKDHNLWIVMPETENFFDFNGN